MYGLIGRIIAKAGKRDELAQILIDGVSGLPGCKSYIVAFDTTDQDSLWITEVWESQEKHRASLTLGPVQDAIAKGRPLIADFGERFETAPLGGYGIQVGQNLADSV
jgi:quinol monooxygenase YgiN